MQKRHILPFANWYSTNELLVCVCVRECGAFLESLARYVQLTMRSNVRFVQRGHDVRMCSIVQHTDVEHDMTFKEALLFVFVSFPLTHAHAHTCVCCFRRHKSNDSIRRRKFKDEIIHFAAHHAASQRSLISVFNLYTFLLVHLRRKMKNVRSMSWHRDDDGGGDEDSVASTWTQIATEKHRARCAKVKRFSNCCFFVIRECVHF